MTQILVVMQGAPGSGKSTLANKLRAADNATHLETVICSTDEYHIDVDGVYRFKPDLLSRFHELNVRRACKLMDEGLSVIVDNTNIFRWEPKPYVEHAVKLGYIPVVFVRVSGDWLSSHSVPLEKVQEMREAMETLTVETVLASVPPWEKGKGA